MKLKVAILAVLIALLGTFTYIHLNKPAKAYEKPVQTVQTAPVKPTPPTVAELLSLINEERAKAGVAPLREDPLLNKSAQMKSQDELDNNYYSHINPDTGRHGYEYIYDVGLSCSHQGENIELNNYPSALFTAKNIIANWMASPPHRAAILDPSNNVTGFGIAGPYLTEHFCDLP